MGSSAEANNGHSSIMIVAIVTAICLLGDSMLYIVLPVYWREAGLNALWEVGILLSINRFVRLPLNPLIGWLYHRMTLRTGLIVAVLLGSAATLGYGLCNGFAVWLLLRAVWGIAWSLLRMGGYFTVISCSDDFNRGRSMGSFNGIYRLGSLIGMLFGGVLAPLVGMKAVAILFGLMALIGLPLVTIFVSNRKATNSAASHSFSGLHAHLRSRPVMKLIMSGLSVSFLYTMMNATLSLVIDTKYAESLALFGALISSTALAGALQAARWVWEPFLAVWFGRKSDGPKGRLPLLFASLVSAGLGFAWIPWPLPVYVWILIVLLVMVTGTAVTTLMDAYASDVGKSSWVIAVMTAYSVATDLGAALGPTISYWMVELTGNLAYVYLSATAVFLCLALWYYPNARSNVSQ